ncbi:MAG: RdgB/HAM1 family non-canonical purine NTP pyrophosphatase [Bacteroidales bacterium]|nr:RdgB/HAM1 family non-canonical purine NTP pyrophosphatase [Bacteroidales bacterium]
MRELVFATNNLHKLKEIRSILQAEYKITGLGERGISEEIPEDHLTLKENAFQKAEFVWKRLEVSCFSDDTGLEIDALNGEPGVFSARYSLIGEPVYPEMDVVAGNIRKVLEKLEGVKNRKARFRTVIALILDGRRYSFEGVVDGSITEEVRGADGFGYDPIFIPDGYSLTFAELDPAEKNRISHRGRAVKKLVNFLVSTDHS